MSDLFIDAGNSAVKWRLSCSPVSEGRFFYENPAMLPAADRIFGSCVASEHRRRTIESCAGRPIAWLGASPRCGILTNAYSAPAALGADRWFGALGACRRFAGRAIVMVHCGTALVADTVLPDGKGGMVFAGGRIAPGWSLMRESLVQRTALLTYADGQPCSIPANTADAMHTGILDALCGVVMGAVESVRTKGLEPVVVFAGGDSTLVMEHAKGVEAVHAASPVLDGLEYAASVENFR